MTIPREPLARFRFVSLVFALALATANAVMILLHAGAAWPSRTSGLAAVAVLAAWWIWGYRRGAYPVEGRLPEALLLLIAGAAAGRPFEGLGLFFAAYQLQALYVRHRQLLWMLIAFGAARVAAVAIVFGVGDQGLLSLPGFGSVAVFTFVGAAMNVLAEGMIRQAAGEAALRRSEERYRLLAGATRDVIYDWNVGAGIIEWSESIHSVFGYAPGDVKNDLAWWLARVHPEDHQRVSAALELPAVSSADTGTTDSLRYRFRRADGRYATVAATGVVQRDPHGLPLRVIGAVRDITTEQNLETELHQAQKMDAIGSLAGGMAHDFNNLLTVIGGHVYLLRREMAGSDLGARHINGIALAADRGVSLIKQLLAFSRKQVRAPSLLNANTVVEEATALIRPLIGENITLATALDPDAATVVADSSQIVQVLITLAVNARDAMPDGGTLTIETGTTTVSAEAGDSRTSALPPGPYVRLAVRDTGIGMDAETSARAFEPFFTTKPPGKGTGLGLSTVYGIIKQSSGAIWVESAPGAGATFTMLIPMALPGLRQAAGGESVDAAAAPAAAVPAAPPVSEPGTILLVEDDDGVREFAGEVLRQAGFRVLAASNGIEGLALAKVHGNAVDLVVTDVVMPAMGGREMVARLRANRPHLRVLYISGYTDDAAMLDELRASEALFMEKPFTAEALVAAVMGYRSEPQNEVQSRIG